MEDPNPTLNPNSDANHLPEADSLPDGFVESSSSEQLGSGTAKVGEENPDLNDYKEEKLVDPNLRPQSVVADDGLPPSKESTKECSGSDKICETVKVGEENPDLNDYKEEKLVDPNLRPQSVVADDGLHPSKESTKECPGSDKICETAKVGEENPDLNDYKEEKLVDPNLRPQSVVADDGLHPSKESTKECPGSDKTNIEVLGPQVVDIREISSSVNTENSKKAEASEGKRKNAKRTFISENEFLEFTLKYQQVLAERDSAIAVRDKLESLCRELQRQNKMLMDECKRVSTEGQNLRLDLSNKFQDAIKEVSHKLDEQKDECLSQLKENEMLKQKLKELADQYTLSEQQYNQKLKQKTLELQIADLKLKQHEEKLIQEQSQMKLYAEQVSQLLATEKNLRLQLTADGEKFQQFQEALLKSNEVFETFKQEIEKMAKSVKKLKKENAFLQDKCEKSDVSLIELVEEREHLKKQLERTRNQKEKLEALCRSLQAERKANSAGTSSDAVTV